MIHNGTDDAPGEQRRNGIPRPWSSKKQSEPLSRAMPQGASSCLVLTNKLHTTTSGMLHHSRWSPKRMLWRRRHSIPIPLKLLWNSSVGTETKSKPSSMLSRRPKRVSCPTEAFERQVPENPGMGEQGMPGPRGPRVRAENQALRDREGHKVPQ
jgi:hypothetical protein